jgi:hypothetical protein
MIGQISVNDADSRTGCVSTGNNGVNGAAEPMCSSSRLNIRAILTAAVDTAVDGFLLTAVDDRRQPSTVVDNRSQQSTCVDSL